MGIKSTRHLTRTQALELRASFEQQIAALEGHDYEFLTDSALGDLLDDLHERLCELQDTTCFDNYLVVNDPNYRGMDW